MGLISYTFPIHMSSSTSHSEQLLHSQKPFKRISSGFYIEEGCEQVLSHFSMHNYIQQSMGELQPIEIQHSINIQQCSVYVCVINYM